MHPLSFVLVAGLAAAAAAQDTSDYVIVGGGTAGCVLARRLCEGAPGAKVTLLERGTPRTPEQELKVRALRLAYETWEDENIAERWDSTPNAGLLGKKVDVIEGKTLGGTSSVNVAQWTQFRFDEYAQIGLRGVTPAEAERLYNKAKSFIQPEVPSRPLWQSFVDDYLAANSRVGVDVIQGPGDGADADRIWINDLLGDPVTGERRDSCTIYIAAALNPSSPSYCPNLNLVQSVTASRILIEGGTAVGVETLDSVSKGGPRVWRATREVIVSAGPFGSPKLLQLSGIGQPQVLGAAGVPVVNPLPVGTDAQGRPTTALINTYAWKRLAPEADPGQYKSAASIAQFERGDGGLLGVSCFITDGTLAPPVDSLTFSTTTAPPQVGALTPYLKLHLSLCLLNPDSRSTVYIKSSNPFDTPEVNLNFLSTGSDADRAAACLRRQRQVINRMPFSYGMKELLPGLLGLNRIITPLRTQARTSTQNAYHYVSGCKVGEVVDQDLKVFGIDNLRVCDSSVLPKIPTYAGPMSSVFATAEWLSERLLA